MKRIRLTVAIIATALVAAGCGAARGELVESGMSDASTGEPGALSFVEVIDDSNPLDQYNVVNVSAEQVVPEVLDFDAVDAFDGSAIDTADVFGHGPVVMAFLTPSCPICVTEGPKLAAAAAMNPDITYVVVHNGADGAAYAEFAATSGLDGENIVHMANGETDLLIHFGILAVPSYVVADEEGRVSKSTGALEDHGLAKLAGILKSGSVTVEA